MNDHEGGPAGEQSEGRSGRVPSRRSGVDPFHVMEVIRAAGERAAAGHEVLHLEVGQPSSGLPPAAAAAARAALDSGDPLGYTDANGIGALRSGIARLYRDRHDLEIDPSRVTVTTGASAACVLAFLACFDAGRRVAVTEPGYPCYRQMLSALGVEAVPVRVDEQTRFQPTPDRLDELGEIHGLVVASPSNPTGSLLTLDELAGLGAWCGDRGAWLIADEIYHGITFDRSADTALLTDPDAVVIGSFSKYFSMTGWRLGWMVTPSRLVRPLELLAQNLMISPPTISQIAGLAALDDHERLDVHVRRYAANRDVLAGALRDMGVTRIAPAEGAFYIWADTSALSPDSVELCREWLAELSVAATPGIDFDPQHGHDWVRFSLAGSTETCRRHPDAWSNGRLRRRDRRGWRAGCCGATRRRSAASPRRWAGLRCGPPGPRHGSLPSRRAGRR